MSDVVRGDPAACSGAGAALLQASAALHADAARVAEARDDLQLGWTGRASIAARRRCDALGAALTATAEEFEVLGRSLQDHAAELADAVGSVREVTARADAAGLVVVDGRVQTAWGVSGEASPAEVVRRGETMARLQSDLDTALLQLDRRRRRLATLARECGRALATISGDMRG